MCGRPAHALDSSSPAAFVLAACILALSGGCAGRLAAPVAPDPSAVEALPRHVPARAVTPLGLRTEDVVDRLAGDWMARGEAALRAGRRAVAASRFDQTSDLLLVVAGAPSPAAPDSAPAPVADASWLEWLRGRREAARERISALELAGSFEDAGSVAEPTGTWPDDRLAVTTFEARDDADAVDAEFTVLPSVPVPMNSRVRSALDGLRKRRRQSLEQSLTRGGRYLPMIRDVFRRHGLPEELAYLPVVESAFKPTAVSRARAVGMWQFMRGTARENGLRYDWYIDERVDPEKATAAAAKYLRTLFGMFDGDWHLALAAYNGGPGRVRRAMRRSGSSDFWAISAGRGYLPRETRNYVPLALAAMVIGADPAAHGLDLRPDPPLRVARVAVPHAVDLDRIAEWSDTSIDEIRELNPELRRWMTPFGYEDYSIKVPAAAAPALRRRLATAKPEDLITPRWHTVRAGESLWRIASRLNITRVDLAAANRLSPSARLQIGQRLLIPAGPADAGSVAPGGRRADARVAEASTVNGVYRVRAGDTLFGIARMFRTTVTSLKLWNRLTSNLIKPGDRLSIRSIQ